MDRNDAFRRDFNHHAAEAIGQLERRHDNAEEDIDLLKRDLNDLVEAVNGLKQGHTHFALAPIVSEPTSNWAASMILDEQRRAIFAQLGELCYALEYNGELQRAKRITILSHVTGRNVPSITDLSEFEADEVIGQLETTLHIVRTVQA